MAVITAQVSYVKGHTKYGYFELALLGEKLEYFKSLNKEEQADYISENGDLLVDEFSIDDHGELENIEIYE